MNKNQELKKVIEAPEGYKFEKISDDKIQLVPIVDLSIINDEDWFCITLEGVYQYENDWLAKGNIINETSKESIHYCISSDTLYRDSVRKLCNAARIKKIRKATKEEIENLYNKHPELRLHKEKEWKDFGDIEGYYINGFGKTIKYTRDLANNSNKDVAPTQKEAEAMIALIQLMQWRDKANGEPLADWCDWENGVQNKYTIYNYAGKIDSSTNYSANSILSFKTEEIRDQFLKDHRSLIERALPLL